MTSFNLLTSLKTMVKGVRYFLLAVLAVGMFPSHSSLAAITGVMSESVLGPDDYIQWSAFGSQNTSIANPTSSTSVGGLAYTVNQTGAGSFMRLDQGSGWMGNFGTGEALLFTGGSNGPISISFATGVTGVGAQIQSDYWGAYDAKLEAFDAGSNSLGSFTLAGVASGAGDDSAIFIGLLSSTADIFGVTFSLVNAPSNTVTQFAIGNVALVTTPIPEPEIYAMMGVGLGLLGWVGRRRKQQAA